MTSSVNVIRRTISRGTQKLHANPLVHRILAARGIVMRNELEYALADLPRPDSLPDIEVAVSRLVQAQQSERVLIVGDYD